MWSGETLGGLRQRAHDELAAMLLVHDMPTICGVGLYGEEAWVRYGGYTYLHRPVPMYWPKDEAELTASAAAFDTLLYDGAPPPQLGFAPVRCVGRICIARRAGGCEPREMARMWYPERLRAMAPAKQLFEAGSRRAPGRRDREARHWDVEPSTVMADRGRHCLRPCTGCARSRSTRSISRNIRGRTGWSTTPPPGPRSTAICR